ncbi:O-antigen polymerase [Desulfarculus baarsii DSM 2075]|uniref:O-antigen polymerase n=2 Tax=Desulfarculus baarsii TaxID=453230 RepID=E1QIC9_DESB2|nr:O-antigen polymerase [Desulfarculus baarsii DSM 2075]
MAMNISSPIFSDRERLSETLFRLCRVSLLTLIIILPMEAITAAREVAMAGFAFLLAASYAARGDWTFRKSALFLPLAFYAFCAVFSLVSAVDFGYSLSEVRSEIIKPLIIFYAALHFVHDEGLLRQALAAVVAGAAIMTFMGVALFFVDGGSLLHHDLRAGSLHNGYGTFSTYLVTIWPYLLISPLVFTERRQRRLIAAVAVCAVLAAYLSYSRACWLSMLVELVLMVIVFSRQRLRIAAVGLLVLALLAASLLLLPGSRHGEDWRALDRIVSDPEEVGGTAGDLVTVWRHTIAQIARRPLEGVGLGRNSFSKAFPEFRDSNQPLLWHAHNMFLDAAVQMGLQGLLALLWLLGLAFWSCWPKAPPAAGRVGDLFKAATAVMIAGFALRNMSDDFFADDSALMVYLLIGLAMGAIEAGRRAKQ